MLLALCCWHHGVIFLLKKKKINIWVHLYLLVTSRNGVIEQNLYTGQCLDMDTHLAASYPCRGHGRSDDLLLQHPSVPAGRQERDHLPDPSPALRTPHPHLPGLCREALYKQGWGCSPPGAEARVEDWALGTGESSPQIWAWASVSLHICSEHSESLPFPISAGRALCGSWGGETVTALPLTYWALTVCWGIQVFSAALTHRNCQSHFTDEKTGSESLPLA